MIHRDIKPSNLLLDTDGVVWVTDFGLAKADEEGLTPDRRQVLGTDPLHGVRGDSCGQADQAVRRLSCQGSRSTSFCPARPAFDSLNRLALIEHVKNVDPPRPRSIDPRIPLDLETIVLKSVEKDAAKARAYVGRPNDGTKTCGGFLADEPIQARQVSTVERYWRWARRNPLSRDHGRAAMTAAAVAGHDRLGSWPRALRDGGVDRRSIGGRQRDDPSNKGGKVQA